MLFDTSVCIDLLRERGRGIQGPAHGALERLGSTPIHISLFSLCELEAGMSLSDRPEVERRRVNALVNHLTVLAPDDAFAVLYGEAAAHLLRNGTPIPVMDLLIGVTAKSRSLPVLTRDTTHFGRIPGLVVEGY